jgi:hypothetical protein
MNSHGQLLALYLLLVSNSKLYQYLSTSTSPATLASNFGSYMAAHYPFVLTTAPPNIGNLYINGAVSQKPSDVMTQLGLTSYSGSGGPCPVASEEAAIISALHREFPYTEGDA